MSHGSPRPIRSDRRGGQRIRRPPRFELLQVVYVRDAHPDLGLVKGESGTIVETLDIPDAAYLAEFINDDGSTRAEPRSPQISSAPRRRRRERRGARADGPSHSVDRGAMGSPGCAAASRAARP
jgi:Domain of unknown function (DUF4926)